MSEQDQATAPQEPAAKRDPVAEQRLQRLLLDTTLPLREGGGIVFPKGFPGRGLHLDAWQFDRYRAELDQAVLDKGARKRGRAAVAVSLFCTLLLLILILGRDWVEETLASVEILGQVVVPLLIIALAGAFFIVGVVQKRDFTFVRGYVDAPKVGRFVFLYHRALRLLAAGAARPTPLIVGLSISVLAAVALIMGDYFAEHHPTLRIVLVGMLGYSSLRRLYMLGVLLHFRLTRGRAPGTGDLKPLSLSTS